MNFYYCPMILIFILSTLILNINTVDVFVDSITGEMTTIRPDYPALWPDEFGECSESVDAQYIEHSDRYHVKDWIFVERVYPNSGAFVTIFTIYDFAEMVLEAHRRGVWHINHDCEEITRVMQNEMLAPVIHSINKQTGKSYLTARLNGLIVDFKCKNAQQYNLEEDYHSCTGNEIHTITQGRDDTIHKRRSKILESKN